MEKLLMFLSLFLGFFSQEDLQVHHPKVREGNQPGKQIQNDYDDSFIYYVGAVVMFAVLLRLHVRAPEPKLSPLRPDGPDDLEEGG